MTVLFSDRAKGVAAAITLSLIFSVIGVFARELDVGFTVYQQIYLRIGLAFLLAAIIFTPYVNWRMELRAPAREWLIVALRGAMMYVGVVLHTYGILHANYGNIAFITVLPIFPLIGLIFFREKISLKVAAYILVGFIGALLLGVHDWGTLSVGVGEISTLVAILFFGFAYAGRRWQSGALSNMGQATGMFFFGALTILLTSFILGDGLPPAALFSPWIIGVIFIAAFLNVFHVTLTNYTFSKLSVTLAGTILMLESVFGLCVSILVYSEYPTLVGLCGAALILLAVYKINQLTA